METGNIRDAMELRREMLAEVNGVSQMEISHGLLSLTERFFSEGNQFTVLAYDGITCIGCATMCFMHLMPTYSHPTGKRAHIMNVYVREAYRRQGIAKEMVNALLLYARQNEITHVSLDATESGRKLYEALGFTGSEEAMEINLTKIE